MLDEATGVSEQNAAPAGGECDVLVIGGGPGGSTIAALLAARGRDVVIVEKDRHPRFHIGESLLPANLPLLERLGVGEEVRKIGLYKPGAEFVSDLYDKSNLFFFATATHLISSYSYHVRRASFDQLLFENARRRGARAFEECRVTEVVLPGEGGGGERPLVRVVCGNGEMAIWRPRFLVDASGRDTFLANKLGLKQSNKQNNSAAVFGHFSGVPRREGEAAGVITAHLVDGGWFWMIPLPDGPMSVGLVGSPALFKGRQKQSLDELFWSVVRSSPSVAARMAEAKALMPLQGTGNYSYTARTSWGDRFLMIGDAFAFIDPIFSSGVMIAMASAELAADVVDLNLADARRGRRALRAFESRVRRATAQFEWLIYRINDPVFRFMLMHPSNRFRMRDGLISLLAGEIFHRSLATRVQVILFKIAYHFVRLVRPLDPPAPAATPLEPSIAKPGR